MACTDRQLQQSQREAAFASSRTGVARAVRPFSGQATPENLVDYLNREVFPALKQNREKLNDIYLQVADNAPSANPLAYYFSTDTANADPTAGRLRLDNATQNLATTIRVSELNGRLASTAAWLDVMAGSSTTPIGVVTLSDAIDPSRFVRFNLDTMADQGAYWNLGVTPVESSHPNPFVEGEAVLVSFIAGVASGGVVSGPTAVQLAAMAGAVSASLQNATGTAITSGTVNVLSMAQTNVSLANVSFRVSGASLVAVAAPLAIAGVSSISAPVLSFSNGGGISFGLASTTIAGIGFGGVITASREPRITMSAGTLNVAAASFVLSNSNNVSFGINGVGSSATVTASAHINVSAGTTSNFLSAVTFSNSNNVSFGMNGSVVTATATVATSLSNIRVSAGTTSNLLSALTFANGGGVSFGLDASTLTATVATSLTNIRVSAGTTSNLLSAITFANGGGVSFGLNASTLTAQVDTLPTIGLVSHVGGNSVSNVTRLAFSDASNVTFSLSTAASAATLLANVGSSLTNIRVSAGTTSNLLSAVTFSNSNNVSFGINASTLTASAVISISALGDTVATNQFLFNSGPFSASTLFFGANSLSENVQVFLSDNTIRANALIRVGDATGGNGLPCNRVNFLASNNMTFGAVVANGSLGGGDRMVNVTASFSAPVEISSANYWRNFRIEGDNFATPAWSNANQNSIVGVVPLHPEGPFPAPMTIATLEHLVQGSSWTTTAGTGSFGFTYRGGLFTLANSTQLTLINSFSSTFSSTTQSFSARQNLYHGQRWFSVHSSQWSSQPVLSAGVNYWYAYLISTAGTSVLTGEMGVQVNQLANFRGFVGVSQTSTQGTGAGPFWGWVSNNAIPTNISQIQIQTVSAANFSLSAPCLQIRNGVSP